MEANGFDANTHDREDEHELAQKQRHKTALQHSRLQSTYISQWHARARGKHVFSRQMTKRRNQSIIVGKSWSQVDSCKKFDRGAI